ncbi:patatin-like phospholipase family protein [Actinophytocola sp.]|uniref:patatin-like phospholipase family protein n=1 Tax=Actinophytocola sp. TaxID=1872138 RepID=UPI003D6A0B2E
MTHPVVSLLSARAAAGARADGHRLALVVEGGGMRGVVSAAMTAAIEELGLTGCFDLVAGTSAGALNGAALLAGVADGCTREYADGFAGREFINPARLLLGRPAVNVEFALDYSSAALDAHRHARAVASDIELHCVATDVATAAPTALTGMSTLDELRGALLATSRLPWVGGRPVEFRGRRWLDGGLTEPVPVPAALAAGATHVLVLLTRALGVVPSPPRGLADRIVECRLRALNPALVTAYRTRDAKVQRMLRSLVDAGESGPPYVLTVAPARDAPEPSRLERDSDVLRAAAEHARRRTLDALAAHRVG